MSNLKFETALRQAGELREWKNRECVKDLKPGLEIAVQGKSGECLAVYRCLS
ncbi:MAG: hypothetical protein LAO31_13720 [Acidobacteriia bacterium]|nr:hypothetical protein [Terriglobia bacterium]